MQVSMPKELIYVLIGLIIGAWFIVGEKTSFLEKLFALVFIAVLYVGFMLLTGASLEDVFAIFK